VSHAAAELAIRKKTYQLGEDASRQSNSTSRILLSRGWPVNGSMWQPGASTFSLPMAGMLILPRHLAFVPCGATASAKRPNESRRRPTRRLPRLPNFQSSFWASSRGDASAVLFSDCRRYKLPNTPDSSPGKRFSNSSDCRKLWIEVPSVVRERRFWHIHAESTTRYFSLPRDLPHDLQTNGITECIQHPGKIGIRRALLLCAQSHVLIVKEKSRST